MATKIVFLSLQNVAPDVLNLELGFSDGTPGGATILDLFPGLDGAMQSNSSRPAFFTQLGDNIIFQATTLAEGRELWITDGTVGGTHILKDINTVAPTGTHSAFATPSNFITDDHYKASAPLVINGAMYFAADDGAHGLELWKTDGTSANTQIVKDINTTGTTGSFLTNFVDLNGTLYFVANDGTNGAQIWKSDGSDGGTVRVTDLADPAGSGIFSLLVSGNFLYFVYNDGSAATNAQQIYVTDGTFGAEHLLSPSHPAILDPRNFADINGTFYFTMNDNVHGFEVWKSNGTDAGTELVKDIYDDGTFGSAAPSSAAFGYHLFNGEVYFSVQNDGTHGSEIWKTNSTAAGTTMVRDINLEPNGPGVTDHAIFDPFSFVEYNGELYFSARDGIQAGKHNVELWKTNGTFAGTTLVADLFPGTGPGTPTQFEVIDGVLYFGANAVGGGFGQLWKYDGVNPAQIISSNYHFGGGHEPFSFILPPSNTPPAQAANTGTAVNEGAGTTILNAQLDFNDPEQSDAQITYTVTSLTANGTLFRNAVALGVGGTFTQADIVGNLLTYTHNGSETTSDSFGFSVSDGIAPAITGQTFAITVTPQNDPPVLNANTGTTVNEGAGTTILNAQLDFDDPDSSDALITYTLTSLTANGSLFRNGVALGAGGTFTQADIVGNLLTYTHNGSETTSDSFGFSVSDGFAPAITGQSFAITVTPQNDPPVLNANTGTTVNEGAGTTILNAQLDFNDPEQSDAQITYTVTSLTANGTLFRNAVALGVGGTFTQADIASNLLSYTHNGGETTSDSFGFSVSDGIAPTITGQTFAITVTPQNDPLSITSNGGGATASINLPENATAVTTVTVTDPDGPSLAFSIVGGDDAAKFQIDASSGALSFITAPNFESPADLDHNNTYLVQVRASDGSLSDDQVITVQVGDATEVLHWIQSVDAGVHPDPNPNPTAHTIGRGLGGFLAPGWLPSGIGDFNNDATSDLAWYHPGTNGIDIWKLSNGQWAGSADTGTHPAGYQPAGVGDFNGDGTDDILWFNATTRDLELWNISNGQWAGSVDIGTHPPGYVPSGVGDFNGDGTSDVLWYNASTHDAEIWAISNGQWAGSTDVGLHPAGYQPTLIGDFDGDGTSDIGWYNASNGALDLWKISNGQWAGSVDLGAHPAGWHPLGAADFNTDGTSDIAWYNPTTNNIDIWLIKDGHWSESVNIGSHPTGPTAIGVGDFDHNGVNDITWFNPNTGQIENWLLAYS